MENPKDKLAEWLGEVFDQYGIDSLYAVTVFTILIAISYRKDIQNWKELEGWRKGIIMSTFFAAIVFSIFSLLRLTGVIDL